MTTSLVPRLARLQLGERRLDDVGVHPRQFSERPVVIPLGQNRIGKIKRLDGFEIGTERARKRACGCLVAFQTSPRDKSKSRSTLDTPKRIGRILTKVRTTLGAKIANEVA
jgi:hypothetical protein